MIATWGASDDKLPEEFAPKVRTTQFLASAEAIQPARSASSRIGTELGCGWATDQQRPKHHSAIQKRDRFALQMTHWVSIVVVSKPHALAA